MAPSGTRSLSFKSPRSHLNDILDAIDMTGQFTAGYDFEAFRTDSKTVAAVERKLLSIAEAAVRLRQDAPQLCPDQPWRNIRGMGNWLRHQYDRVDIEIVWNTVTDDLPALKDSVRRTLLIAMKLEPERNYRASLNSDIRSHLVGQPLRLRRPLRPPRRDVLVALYYASVNSLTMLSDVSLANDYRIVAFEGIRKVCRYPGWI